MMRYLFILHIIRFICCLLVLCIMIKNEQSRGMNQHKRPTSITSIALPLLPPPPPLPSVPMLSSTSGILSQRHTDSNAVDITSVKGQFAWEKIPHSDTYIPILFRYVFISKLENLTHSRMIFSSMASLHLSKKRKSTFLSRYLNHMQKKSCIDREAIFRIGSSVSCILLRLISFF